MNDKKNASTFVSTNIKYLRTTNGKTQQDIADLCEKQNTAVANWEKGIRMPDVVDLAVLSNYFNVSIKDLLFTDLRFQNAEATDINSDTFKIPVYGTIIAGLPIESQNNIIEYVDIPKDWIKNNKKFYGLKISDNSMFPKYSEDDIVILEQLEDKEASDGKDCVVMINGTESTFKKVLLNSQGIVLQPYNTAYNIMVYSNEQIEQLPIKIVGIAREKRTRLWVLKRKSQ